MLRRCINPNIAQWKFYGGANPPVTVCERWRGNHGFENFLADMGERPTPKHTLSRLADSGNYEPGNVAWHTWKQQREEALKGGTSSTAKLTDSQASEIRKRKANGEKQRSLAIDFRVSESTISSIILNKTHDAFVAFGAD
jgi:hypothetical protein